MLVDNVNRATAPRRAPMNWLKWAIEVGLPLAIAAALMGWVWRQGMPDRVVLMFLAIISPMVGEFAETMAVRYEPGMTYLEALGRFARPSRCDSCSMNLSQWDIVPVVPYALRRGKCGCGRFKVPADCTIAGLVVFAVALLIIAYYMWRGVPEASIVPLTVFLSFVPALVADLRWGELDEWLILLAAPGCIAVAPPGWVPLESAALASGSLVASALLAAGARWQLRPFPIGLADILVAGVLGLALNINQVISASILIVPVHGAVFGLLWCAGRFGWKWAEVQYGPGGEVDYPAAPLVPSLVVSGVLALLWPWSLV